MTVDVDKRAVKRAKAEAARREQSTRWNVKSVSVRRATRCRTIDGKPTAEHILRHPFFVNARDFRRYPAACPICKVAEGLHCKSLYNGKRVHPHRDRPMR